MSYPTVEVGLNASNDCETCKASMVCPVSTPVLLIRFSDAIRELY